MSFTQSLRCSEQMAKPIVRLVPEVGRCVGSLVAITFPLVRSSEVAHCARIVSGTACKSPAIIHGLPLLAASAKARLSKLLFRNEAPSVWKRHMEMNSIPVSRPAWIHKPAIRPGSVGGERSNDPPTSPVGISDLTAMATPAEVPSRAVRVA